MGTAHNFRMERTWPSFGNGRADMIGSAFGEFNDSLKAGHAAHPAC
jgi:hypothetical protein